MTILLITVFIISIILMLALMIFLFKRKTRPFLPYYKNPYFISHAEGSFYKVLEQTLGDTYYIFPQVSLGSLLRINKNEREFWGYLNKINRKSVDFVIASKNFVPLIVIELDDKSHKLYQRKERDMFLQQALKSAKIRLVRLPVKSAYSVRELRGILFNQSFMTNA